MKILCSCLLFLLPALSFTGCGMIYTHITTPLDLNMDRTPIPVVDDDGDIKHFRYYVDIMWGSNAIGDIAKQNGFDEVYFADREFLSVLGIWEQETIHVYGR